MAENHAYILREFILKHNIKTFVEIGVYKSATLRKLLRWNNQSQLEEYWAVDPWSQVDKRWGAWLSRRSQETWDSYYRKACCYLPWYPHLRILRMPSERASKLFANSNMYHYFDLVYIDASHFYKDVVNDIKCWLPLVKRGGYLGGHDFGLNGEYSQEVSDAVYTFFKKEEVEIYPDRVWMKKL